MKNQTLLSLREIIRQKISNRIVICMFIVFFIPFVQATQDLLNTIKKLENSIYENCVQLENFTIGQSLVNNVIGAEINLQNFNRNHRQMHVEWIKDSTSKAKQLTWIFPGRWVYNYPLRSIGQSHFGYFHVTGTFLLDKNVTNVFLKKLLLLFSLSCAIFFLLYPLVQQIPQKLFIMPINEILNLLITKKLNPLNPLKNYESQTNILELKEIEDKIISLVKQINEQYHKEALLQITAQVAHDIRSPLSALNAMIRSTDTIPEQQRIMIRNAAQRINDIANNLLLTYRQSESLTEGAQVNNPLSSELIFNLLDHIVSEKRVQYNAEKRYAHLH